ncbi:LacI family DNA-binding transcriptional regulator [Vibrio maritimus]|uniref:LacI family DNA-binding transcriptional regulator n=1 Tax=Vibrio maritimus TaxID=990268 RepID=UPI0037358C90
MKKSSKVVKKPTLDYIAELAGVSKTTVSRALNKSHLVKDDVVEHIRKIAEQAGYVNKNTKLEIPLSLTKVTFYCLDHLSNHSSFYSELIASVKSEFEKTDIEINVVLYNKHTSSSVLLKGVSSSQAALILGEPTEKLMASLNDASIPTLLLNAIDDEMIIPSIHPDYELGGFLAGKYLIKKGHTKIKVITSNDRHSTIQRTDGFLRALSFAGIDFEHEDVVVDLHTYEQPVDRLNSGDFGAQDILPKLIDDGLFADCTAVFCICDMIAFSLINALANANIVVPNDISVIGFDNLTLTSCVSPKLTTLNVNYNSLAQASLIKLVRLTNDPNVNGNRTAIPVSLVERESVRTLTQS